MIIIAAPSIADNPDSQLFCAAADLTVLVVTKRLSRTGDVTSAAEMITSVRGHLIGAVMIGKPKKMDRAFEAVESPKDHENDAPMPERLDDHPHIVGSTIRTAR
jgi:hypothetical protein